MKTSNRTERDLLLLRSLGSFGVFSTKQIARIFFPGVARTTVLRRLRHLEKGRFLRRVWGHLDGGYAWYLTKGCALELGFPASLRRINRNNLEHDVLLSDVRVALAKAQLGQEWVPEFEIKRLAEEKNSLGSQSVRVIPDGILTVEGRDGFRAVAVELELKAKNKMRYKETFSKYARKQNLWRVWYLVPTVSMGRMLEREWKKSVPSVRAEQFMWSLVAEVVSDPTEARVHSNANDYLLTQMLTL